MFGNWLDGAYVYSLRFWPILTDFHMMKCFKHPISLNIFHRHVPALSNLYILGLFMLILIHCELERDDVVVGIFRS